MPILPELLAGPMVRHCHADQVNLWLVTDKDYDFSVELTYGNSQEKIFNEMLTQSQHQKIQLGEKAVIHLIHLSFEHHLPENVPINYQINAFENNEKVFDLSKFPELYYQSNPLHFVIKKQLNKVLHGSCRKPHFDSEDGLLQVDQQIEQSLLAFHERPAMLMMSGDQVYCDDVCGPMLNAIHQVVELLGLYDESWQLSEHEHHHIDHSQALFNSEQGYYQRHLILPHESINHTLVSKLFGASKQPIFTSVNAKNHLVTVAEVFALYLLTWSPVLWRCVDLTIDEKVPEQFKETYQNELVIIEKFSAGLDKVQRALAHIPTYMIFDDHDITDDWNLTRLWEEFAYQNPMSKRIIGNALLGYLLFQGWGNSPNKVASMITAFKEKYNQGSELHDELINQILDFDEWHYHLDTLPKVVVLDTRTNRWRSESFAGKPSGLMDWESLCELQQELIGQPSVIMVSAAPVYGVKLIETIQRVFTFFGKPLMVDAENWMAHSGTANVMLNIFRHHKTPPNFIILSGDVHYSFVYEIEHRFIRTQSSILQVTCSGIKNQFPPTALKVLAKLNTVLYATYSPLNWFTKRRRMKIRTRRPSQECDGRLINQSGIGLLELDGEQKITKLLASNGEVIDFQPINEKED